MGASSTHQPDLSPPTPMASQHAGLAPVGVTPDIGELLNATGTIKPPPHERTFVFRVVGIAIVLLVLFGLLGIQLVRLTLIGGAASRRDAQSRLYREMLMPTSRGAILDSKGRTLARNRSSLELQVQFSVLSGTWARKQARTAAYRANTRAWWALSEDERAPLIEPYERAVEMHVDAMWTELASRIGVDGKELRTNANVIRVRVEDMRQRHIAARIASELKQLEQLDRLPTETDRQRIERTNANRRVAEQNQSHTIIERLSDRVGFDLIRTLDLPVDVLVVFDDGTTGLMQLPEFPGVVIAETNDREYPFEMVTVQLDRSTLPHAIREDATQRIRVNGAETILTGRLRTKVYDTDVTRRARAVQSNEQLRARSVVTVDRASVAGFGAGTPRDLGAYREGDAVGISGVEFGAEHTLRGTRGLRIVRLDTNEATEVDRQVGSDVQLTIDIMLQARILAILDPDFGLCKVQRWHYPPNREPPYPQPMETPLNAGAVVIEVDTGRVIAMASTPVVSRQDIAERFAALNTDRINTPLVNRAFQKVYAPGSIVKPLILCAAQTLGASSPGEGIECTGHLYAKSPNTLRCWLYKMTNGVSTHSDSAHFDGPVLGTDALTVSCNIYFYTLGRRLGVDGISRAYDMFGVGKDHPFNFGLGPEFIPAVGVRSDGKRIERSDTTYMGIGQGPIQWTPMHAASAYCTLARGGIFISPTVRMDADPEMIETGVRAASIDEALEGLRGSVYDYNGTGHWVNRPAREEVFNVPGVRLWAKTGTADAADVVIADDPDGTGPERAKTVALGDHAWYVALVGANKGDRSRPEYAIAVVVDHGGSGGRVAGPVVNQIVHALVHEGYITPGETENTTPSEPVPGLPRKPKEDAGPNRLLSMQDNARGW